MSAGLFDDEVIENICDNIRFIAADGYDCAEKLRGKPTTYRHEMIYCYNLGEDYAMSNPHAISAVWFFTEDANVIPINDVERVYPYNDMGLDLLVGLLVNDAYKMMRRKGISNVGYNSYPDEMGVDPVNMACNFRERRDFPFVNPVMEAHKKNCLICFLAGIRNVFKSDLKKSQL